MNNSIRFEDHSDEVKNAIDKAVIAWLYESAGEVVSRVADVESREDTGELKESWKYQVDESVMEAYVGSAEENAIWEEFGTGEYALYGNGRPTKWYVHESQLTNKARSKMKKVYGKNGNVFYETTGKRPQRALYKAFKNKESVIRKRLNEVMKGVGA